MQSVAEMEPLDAVEPADTVRRAQGGDVEAFERLYRENVERVYALCLRLTADRAEAEERTQDVFVRAWQRLASFRGESAFSTWLHRLAVNEVLGARRADGRRGARILLTDDVAACESADGGPGAGARLDLEDAMARLPAATRTVFVMHDVEGYTHAEIARLTGRAEGTCKSLLHRARAMLRERLR